MQYKYAVDNFSRLTASSVLLLCSSTRVCFFTKIKTLKIYISTKIKNHSILSEKVKVALKT